MATLRNTQIQEIKNTFKESKDFTMDDFILDFPDDHNRLVTIQYRGLSKYYFYIEENILYSSSFLAITEKINGGGKKTLQTVEAPGEYKNQQTSNHENFNSCIYQVRTWLGNLRDDLKNINACSVSKISDMDKIQEILDEKIPNEEERFSNEDIVDLEKKLQELQERIEILENEGEISSEEANKSTKIIEQSKDNLQTYPKKAWYLNFYNKMKSVDGVMRTLSGLKGHAGGLLEWFDIIW